MSKKIGLTALLVIVMVFAMTAIAFAAQNLTNDNISGTNDYQATPKAFNDGGVSGNAKNNTNTVNYPNGIYLPNAENPAAYRIHSNYTATTDACASCHATHTAVGASLLQWGTVYDTCMACHDGTITTTYNVEAGNIGTSGDPTFAGAFGTMDDQINHSGSNHNVTGALSIYAAPGGYGSTGNTAPSNPGLYNKQQSWDVEFGCQSCHNPHGQGGNARLLNPDVNGVGWAKYNDKTTKAVALVDSGNGYYVTKAISTSTTGDTWILGYPYSDVTKVYAGTATLENTQYTLDNKAGFTKITITDKSVTGPFTADFVPSLVVKMNIANYLNDGGKESVSPVSGMNAFCGACHTDYNTNGDGKTSGSGHTLTGQFAQAYRHQVGMDGSEFANQLNGKDMALESGKVTCETCHFAHGTNQTFWNRTAGATYNVAELAGSSALKRLPNMGTCEACHEKGVGNQGYDVNSGTIVTVADKAKDTVPGGGYVGENTCVNCHKDYVNHFNETWHPQKTRPGVTEEVAKLAETADFTAINTAIKATSGQTVDLQAEIAATEAELANVKTNANGTKDYTAVNPNNITVWSWGKDASRIALRGSKLHGTAEGTTDGDSWFLVASSDEQNGALVFNTQKVGPYTCFGDCHTTGYNSTQVGFVSPTGAKTAAYTGNSADLTVLWLNQVTKGLKPAFDIGVTCEACHGQGANHAKAPSAKNIVNPAKQDIKVQTVGVSANNYLNSSVGAKACSSCHSGATHQGDFYSSNIYLDHGTYPYSSSTDINKATLNAYSPSAHFTNSLLSCNSCHNSHEKSTVGNQLKSNSPAQLCGSCHGNISTVAQMEHYMPLAGTETGFGVNATALRKHGSATGVPQYDPALNN